MVAVLDATEEGVGGPGDSGVGVPSEPKRLSFILAAEELTAWANATLDRSCMA